MDGVNKCSAGYIRSILCNIAVKHSIKAFTLNLHNQSGAQPHDPGKTPPNPGNTSDYVTSIVTHVYLKRPKTGT